MSKFAEPSCEDKHVEYFQLLEEYLVAQMNLELAQIDNKSWQEIRDLEMQVTLPKDDMQSMYDNQDSRCTLPSLEQAITLSKIGYYMDYRRKD